MDVANDTNCQQHLMKLNKSRKQKKEEEKRTTTKSSLTSHRLP